MPPDDSNPYEYRGSSQVDFAQKGGQEPPVEVSGTLVAEVDPDLVREARTQILTLASFSLSAQRGRWLFLIFLVAIRFLRPNGSPFLFWGAASAYGVGTIAAQTFLRRLMTLGMESLNGTSPEKITLQLREDGIRIKSSHGMGHFAWGLVRGHKVVGSSFFLLMPTWFHPMGFVMQCDTSSVPLSEIDSFAQRCRLQPANQKVTNQLCPSVDFGNPTWSVPEVIATGIVRNRDIALSYADYWTTIRKQFFFSLISLIGMILLCYSVVECLMDLQWLALVAISPMMVLSAIRLARGIRVIFIPGTAVSDVEMTIHSEGIVKRTNSLQIAIPWSAFQEAHINEVEWRGILHMSPNHPVVLLRKYFATEDAWRKTCDIAKLHLQEGKGNRSADHGM
ncbi:MAG: hypothetical protein U0905_21200 [Pirellulales bacterium]